MTALAHKLAKRPVDTALVIGSAEQTINMPQTVSQTTSADSVALCLSDPVAFIQCLLSLDGHVARLVLLSHALSPDTVSVLCDQANCDTLVSDRDDLDLPIPCLSPDAACSTLRGPACETHWTLTTSGTTGLPKLIPHTLNSLTRTVVRGMPQQTPRWGLLYDPTRFAGLQVVLQALIGGGVLLTPDTHTPLASQIDFLRTQGCTHLC